MTLFDLISNPEQFLSRVYKIDKFGNYYDKSENINCVADSHIPYIRNSMQKISYYFQNYKTIS